MDLEWIKLNASMLRKIDRLQHEVNSYKEYAKILESDLLKSRLENKDLEKTVLFWRSAFLDGGLSDTHA